MKSILYCMESKLHFFIFIFSVKLIPIIYVRIKILTNCFYIFSGASTESRAPGKMGMYLYQNNRPLYEELEKTGRYGIVTDKDRVHGNDATQ